MLRFIYSPGGGISYKMSTSETIFECKKEIYFHADYVNESHPVGPITKVEKKLYYGID